MDILKVYEIINNKMGSWKNCFLNEAILKKLFCSNLKKPELSFSYEKNDKNVM